ncbi:MAG TPA: T9SS type A sorting domain-containing protein [Bacteroidales bacterium]|nr:T9SS type A sorting domain-containing protein [Bacteroidales bacterium]
MKKITLLSIMIMFCASVFAQNTTMDLTKNKSQIKPKAAKPMLNQAKAIIWQNDFSVATNWTLTHLTGTTDNWVIGTTGPSGTYAIDPIASTTAANGFALFDSDALCSGNQVAHLTTTTSFSCAGHPNVRLSFQEMYRRYYDSTFVYVSNNGTTWTKFPVNQNFANNDITANPTTVNVNISSVAGNQATVWIRFTFYSPSSMGTNAGCGYSWMVDDVVVSDLVANDIEATQTFLDVDGTGAGYYEVVPYSQMGTIYYGEGVANNGSAAQTNVTLAVNINNGAVTANSTPVASFAANAKDTLWASATIAAPGTPTFYDARLSVSQTETDANPADNLGDSVSFLAFPNYFSRTQDFDSYLTSYSFGTAAPAITGMEYGANYRFKNADQIDSISVIIYKNIGNTSITAKLYTVTGSNVHTLVGQSAAHNITAADSLPAYITLGLTTPYSVAAGTTVCATIALTLNIAANDTIFVGSDDNFVADASVAGAAYLRVGTTWGWYSVTGLVPIADLITYNPTTGINETETDINFSVYPNPAREALNIVSESNIISMKVMNAIGQVVATDVPNSKSLAINTSDFISGIYFVQVQTTKGMSTKKVLITK